MYSEHTLEMTWLSRLDDYWDEGFHSVDYWRKGNVFAYRQLLENVYSACRLSLYSVGRCLGEPTWVRPNLDNCED